MTVRESGEMYLEAILVLAKKTSYVRSIDVSEYLGYSKPSVSRAMGILRQGGYILMEKDGAITLTDSGRKLAETIYERHTVFSELLMRLGVDEKPPRRTPAGSSTPSATSPSRPSSATTFSIGTKEPLNQLPSAGWAPSVQLQKREMHTAFRPGGRGCLFRRAFFCAGGGNLLPGGEKNGIWYLRFPGNRV